MNFSSLRKPVDLVKSVLRIYTTSYRVALSPPKIIMDGELPTTATKISGVDVNGVMVLGLREKEITSTYDPTPIKIIPSDPVTFIDFMEDALLISEPTEVTPKGKWALFNGEKTKAIEVVVLL